MAELLGAKEIASSLRRGKCGIYVKEEDMNKRDIEYIRPPNQIPSEEELEGLKKRKMIFVGCKKCRKCNWCARWNNHDVITDKRWFTYSCQFPTHLPSFSKGIEPTFDERCPHFREPYKEDGDEGD